MAHFQISKKPRPMKKRRSIVVKADGLTLGKRRMSSFCGRWLTTVETAHEMLLDNKFDSECACGHRGISWLAGRISSLCPLSMGISSVLPTQDHKPCLRWWQRVPITLVGWVPIASSSPFRRDLTASTVVNQFLTWSKEGRPPWCPLRPGLILSSDRPKVIGFNSRFWKSWNANHHTASFDIWLCTKHHWHFGWQRASITWTDKGWHWAWL